MAELHTAHYLCIGCPLGCRLEVDEEAETHAIVEVRGFSCRRGQDYARQEHTAPRRIVTTTVAIAAARWPRLPVRSSAPVPKALVMAICRALRTVRVSAPVTMGDIIVPNVSGVGVDIIAACDMPQIQTKNIE